MILLISVRPALWDKRYTLALMLLRGNQSKCALNGCLANLGSLQGVIFF